MPAGRPTKYDPGILSAVKNYCLLGCTDEQLAEFLGVHRDTISEWKTKYPEFSDTLKSGKEKADAEIAESLYQKAKEGDSTSMIFWLKNRRKQYWRDKQDYEHTGANGGPIQTESRIVIDFGEGDAEK